MILFYKLHKVAVQVALDKIRINGRKYDKFTTTESEAGNNLSS